MRRYGIEGGAFWRWVNYETVDDANATFPGAIKRGRIACTYNPAEPRSALASFPLPEGFTWLGAREEQAFAAPLERDAQNVYLIRVHVEEHAIDDAGAAEAPKGSRLQTDQDGLAEMLHAAGRKRERASVAIADRQRRGHVGSDARLR